MECSLAWGCVKGCVVCTSTSLESDYPITIATVIDENIALYNDDNRHSRRLSRLVLESSFGCFLRKIRLEPRYLALCKGSILVNLHIEGKPSPLQVQPSSAKLYFSNSIEPRIYRFMWTIFISQGWHQVSGNSVHIHISDAVWCSWWSLPIFWISELFTSTSVA